MGKRQHTNINEAVELTQNRKNEESEETDSDYSPSQSSKNRETLRLENPQKRKKRRLQSDQPARLSNPNEQAGGDTNQIHPRSSHDIQSPSAIRLGLLRWYTGVHASRGMPWRKPYDPSQGPEERAQRAYEVWVSEIMLQQTQVATVIPYYSRWMSQFPTIHSLASATVDEVNGLWKGLGYYSRASRLLAGAKKAVANYGGRLPDNAKDMEANIPGIGRYSAGAICSIAYGERVPVLDGNVNRLLSRLLALHAPPKAKATLDILWAAASILVELDPVGSTESQDHDASATPMEQTQYPGDINQALIELGSTVCKVREPDCGSCPLRPWCRGFITAGPEGIIPEIIPDIEDACTLCEPLPEGSTITSYPMKVERKKAREELDVVNVIEWRARTNPTERHFLLVRRPEGGLLAGLYEFPTSSNISKATSRNAMAGIPNKLLAGLIVPTVLTRDTKRHGSINTDNLQIKSTQFVGDVVHVFSHIKKTYRAQWVILEGGEAPPPLRLADDGRRGKRVKNHTAENLIDGKVSTSLLPIGAMWVKLKDVGNVNMGTGVVKVWNLTRDLWERELSGA
ncbi:DNA glycosylase [Collybia nuda]|uniref:Adenine DNA glycosylase n=1 Tax=Collybia nuda TaxID=64659 RepID=A0A9P5Y1Q2_9AGAR|nr:DNA glycosylase [Collybia nuda]